MEPSLGGTSASPDSHSFFFFFLLSPVSWTPGCLIQQQWGRASWARRGGISVEHEVQEGHAGVRLPLPGTLCCCFFFLFLLLPVVLTGGFFHDKHGAPPSPALALLLPSPPPSTHTPSSTLWVHRAGIHLHHIYPQTHVHEAPEKTCGAGVEWNPSSAAGLSVWGRAGYHVHLNKGPVFRRTSWESSRTPPFLPSLIIMPAPRLLQQDKLSRTTCRCLQSGCRCRRAAQMNKTEQKCEGNFLRASMTARNESFLNKASHFFCWKEIVSLSWGRWSRECVYNVHTPEN